MADKMFVLKFCCIVWCLCAVGLSHPAKKKDKPRCGYESCHPTKDDFINVHIVPHTHDDVGWLKTVDQYYYGDKNYIQNAGVRYILDSVMDSLRVNQERRFIYVETAFFWKWWMQQDDSTRHRVQKYVRNGQLEFVGGAWTMNDEATTHYQSIIDQFTWGLRKLNDTFGECGRPKVGWQIDPFGHSREMASLFAQMGYDGILLGRIDYQDKEHRFYTKKPEFTWQASANLGNKSSIFTSVMYNTYSPPPGFCFDILCMDEPIVDDINSFAYNVDRKVNAFFAYLNNVTKAYATNHVIITMGEDFNYQAAHTWFTNLDKLILYANKRQKRGSKYNLIYSTPSCYLKAVQDAGKGKISWSNKSDDFFPYASDSHAYWTGYFSSRPTLKRYERVGNNYLQVCKQLYTLASLGPEDWADLNTLREAMGVMQHHDAITGTEKQQVAYDYARLLSKGFDECEYVTRTALSKLVTGRQLHHKQKYPSPEANFQSCLLTNMSQCEKTEASRRFVVTVYNPLSRNVTHYVRLPVTGTAFEVLDYNGNNVPSQLMPIPNTILNIPGRDSESTVELIFIAKDVPPLGFISFYVSEIPGNNVLKSKHLHSISYQSQIGIDPETGKVNKIKINDQLIQMDQDFYYYRGAVGNNSDADYRSSGAYIFRPNKTAAFQVAERTNYELFEGEIVGELRQVFNEWTSQIVRAYKDEAFIEFDWLIGPLPINDVNGKEVITRYSTDLKTHSTFYTDSNGREMLKRVKNYRPTWDITLLETVAGNYYPVTSKIVMQDLHKNVEVAVLTDRAQGGTSLSDGEIELMLHRSCLHDDAFGVNENLLERAFGKGLVTRGSHYLIAGPISGNEGGRTVAAQERDIAQRKLLAAWTFITETTAPDFETYKTNYNMRYSGLSNSLPDNVQILTLEPWKANTFLLRLEHVLEKNEDPILSQPATVSLKNLFATFDIIWYNETTLGADQWLKDNEKNKKENDQICIKDNNPIMEDLEWEATTWRLDSNQIDSNDIYTVFTKYHYNIVERNRLDYMVTLEPMQIRTFIIEVRKKRNFK
ncbi:hypothetical protein Trydic_g20609 [Trypoxylus dichotomus]